MIMTQELALRVAKIMKIGWREEAFCGRVILKSEEVTELGAASVTVSWHKENSTAPRSILIEGVRPAFIMHPEFYANWSGFTQAYGVRLEWRD